MGLEFKLTEYMKGTYGEGLRLPDLGKKVAKEEFEGRVERLKKALAELGLDAVFAYGDETRPEDVGWLTGYCPDVETALVVGQRRALVLRRPEGEACAKETMRAGEFRCLEEFKIPGRDYPGVQFHKIADVFREATGRKPKRIGALTVGHILSLGFFELIKESTGAEIVDCSDWMLNARCEKSAAELEMTAIAAYVSTIGMDALIRSLEPGKRETECAAAADYVMRSMGADRFGFATIVCSGTRASNAIGRASNRVIEEGDLVVLGTSAGYDGMSAALGRTIVAGGKGNPDKFELIEHCVKAFQSSRAAYQCGAAAKAPDLAAKDCLRSVGLDSKYGSAHDIRWSECQEGPGADAEYSTNVLPKGIASQIGVGIFGVPFKSLSAEEVGVRVEDPFCIDHEGRARRLTSLPPNVNHLVFKG